MKRDCYEKGVSLESNPKPPKPKPTILHPRPRDTFRCTGLRSPMWNELLRGSGRSIEISRAPWEWEENGGHFFQWEIPPSGLKNAKMRAFFETKWFCFGWGMLLTNHRTDVLGSTWSGSRTKKLHLYCELPRLSRVKTCRMGNNTNKEALQ